MKLAKFALTPPIVAISVALCAAVSANEVMAASHLDTSSPAAYAKRVAFTVADTYMAEGVTLTDFPLLVRLSTAISGFDYNDFLLPGGGDLMFTDADGRLLSHEVDEWNVDGTSYVWVKVPSLKAGAVITMHMGNGAQPPVDAADVWRDYYGVWHFNEASGPALDSSGNGRDAMPIGSERASMVATAPKGGVGVGMARTSVKNAYFQVGMADFVHGGRLAFTGWFYNNTRDTLNIGQGSAANWFIKNQWNSYTQLAISANNKTVAGNVETGAKYTDNVVQFGVSFDGVTADCFGAGKVAKSGEVSGGQLKESTVDLTFPGVNATGTIDEFRLKKTPISADWEKAEYDVVRNAGFLSVGEVSAEPAGVVLATPVVTKTETGWSVTASLVSGVAKIGVVYTCGEEKITRMLSDEVVEGPASYTDEPTGLSAGSAYDVTVVAQDAEGNVIATVPGTGLFTGEVQIEKLQDADDGHSGRFRVSRPEGDASTAGAIAVHYTLSGTAVAEEDYLPLSGTVVIPKGETEAFIAVVTPGLASRSTTLTVELAAGGYAIGEAASATASVTSQRDPMTLTWAGGAGTKDFNAAVNWDPQYTQEPKDTLVVAAEGSEAYKPQLTRLTEVSNTGLTIGDGAMLTLDFNGFAYANELAFTVEGDGGLEIKNGALSAASFSLKPAVLRLSGLVLTNTTENAGITFSRPGQAVEIDEVGYWVTRNSQSINAFTLSGEDITVVASNLVVNPNIRDGSGENININVTGKRNTLDLSGTNTYLKGGFVFGSASAGNTVTMREGVTAGGWTGAGSTSFSMDGASNVLQFLDSKAKATLSYPKINGEGNVLRAGEGGNLSVGNDTTFNGTGNRIESYGTLAFTGAFNFGTGAASSGNRLLVSGDDAVISFSSAFKTGNDTDGNDPVTLEFVAGTNFWAEAPIRLASTSATLAIALSNTVFAVDAAPALDAMKKNRCKLPLMSFKSANATNVDWTAFNDTLVMPKLQHGALRLETTLNNKGAFSSATLWCDVKRDVGLMILVK